MASWLLPLDGFQFIFLLRDSENDLKRVLMFIINLSHDIHLVIDCNISPHTAVLHQVIVSIYWKELLALTWLVVNGVSQTSLMVGGFWSKAFLALIEEQTSLSHLFWYQYAVVLSDHRHPHFRNLNFTVPVDAV